MFKYHVVYSIKHPRRRGTYVGDMTIERRDPVTTPERIVDLKLYIGRNQRQLDCIPHVEWITLTFIFELSSRP